MGVHCILFLKLFCSFYTQNKKLGKQRIFSFKKPFLKDKWEIQWICQDLPHNRAISEAIGASVELEGREALLHRRAWYNGLQTIMVSLPSITLQRTWIFCLCLSVSVHPSQSFLWKWCHGLVWRCNHSLKICLPFGK